MSDERYCSRCGASLFVTETKICSDCAEEVGDAKYYIEQQRKIVLYEDVMQSFIDRMKAFRGVDNERLYHLGCVILATETEDTFKELLNDKTQHRT